MPIATIDELREYVRACEHPTIGVSVRLTVVRERWFSKLREMVGLDPWPEPVIDTFLTVPRTKGK
jgi:hypothetical protein